MELCRGNGFNPRGLGTFEITLSNIEWDSHVPGLDGSLMGASPVHARCSVLGFADFDLFGNIFQMGNP